MPLYEYRCTKCGHQFEKIQTFSAPDAKECPLCQSAVERLISAPAVHFSGSGFYATDYKSKPTGGASTAASGSSDSSSSSPGDSSSAKPATPATAASSSSETTSGSSNKSSDKSSNTPSDKKS